MSNDPRVDRIYALAAVVNANARRDLTKATAQAMDLIEKAAKS